MRRIKKFKLKDGKVIAKYTEEKNGSVDEVEITSDDEPLKTLLDALQGLSKYVVDICELQEIADVKVTGIALSWNVDQDGEEVMGAVIIAQNKLQKSTGVVPLNTPHRISNYYAEHGDAGQLMPDGMEEDISLLLHYINNYINGDRVGTQKELFEEVA